MQKLLKNHEQPRGREPRFETEKPASSFRQCWKARGIYMGKDQIRLFRSLLHKMHYKVGNNKGNKINLN